MILLQNRYTDAFFTIFSSRKFSRRTRIARRRLAELRAVTARQRFGLASRAAALGLAGLLAHASSVQAATYIWTAGDTAGVWNSTSTTTDWDTASYPNAAGTIVKIGAGGTPTLNVNATVGEVVNNTTSSGANFSIKTSGTTYYTLTFDATGQGNNYFGSANLGAIADGSSVNTDTVNTNISIANTDLELGTTYSTTATSGVSIGTAGATTLNNAGNNGDGTTAHNLIIRGSDKAGFGVTINSDIGTSGAPIAINDVYNTGYAFLNGNLGSKVTSLTLNSTTTAGAIYLAGANANYTGASNIQFGTLAANASTNAGVVTLGTSTTAGILNTNGFTVTVQGLSTGTGATLANQQVTGSGGLVFTTGTTEFDGLITGAKTLAVNSGTLTLNGAGNSYTGVTTLNGGTLNINSEYALGGAVYGGLTFGANGGTLIYNSTPLNATTDITQNSAATPVKQNVTLTGAATINTNGSNVSYANTFGNSGAGSLTKAGAGALTLAATTYTGSTTVSGGSLILGSTTLPASPTFTVAGGATLNISAATAGLALNSGKTLTSTATSGTTATVVGGATLNAGVINASVAGSTLQTTTLALSAGTLNYNITDPTATTGTSSLINVTGSNGLTINGGTVSLTGGTFSFGTTYNITYDLFQFAGSLQGTGPSALSLTPASQTNGLSYAFGLAGNDVTLTVSGTPLFSANWITDGSGSWASASNWDNGVPNAQFATAIFGGAAATHANLARTVTLDGSKTVGAITFASPNGESYMISDGTGGTLTLDNGTGVALLSVGGTHTIDSTVPVDLSSNLTVNTTNSTDKLTVGGVITNTNTGALAATLTKTGLGTLVLSNANLYGPVTAGTVGTNLNGGIIQVGNNFSFGAGDVNFGGNATVQSGAAGLTLPNNFTIGNGFTGTVDANGNTLILSGTLSGTGSALTVASSTGAGTVVLTGAATYDSGTNINSGATLQVGNSTATGSLPSTGAIVDNGSLVFNRSDASTIAVANAISGTGTVVENGGTGNILQLNGTNTYSGTTTITTGAIQLLSSGGIGTGDLSIASAGSLDLKGFSATVGGLSGAGTIDSSAAGTMTLSIGNNGDSGTFSGAIKNTVGTVSVAKNGAGTETLSGAETYTGTTSVNAGTLTFTNALGAVGTPAGLIGDAAGNLNFTGATVYASGLYQNGGYTTTLNGAITLTGSLAAQNNNPSLGGSVQVTGGTVAANSVTVGRGGITTDTTATYPGGTLIPLATGDGMDVTGGALNVTTTLQLGTSTSNSTVFFDLSAGSVTVGGTTGITNSNGGRYSVLDIEGGTFTSNDTTGAGILIGGSFGTVAADLQIKGGTLNTNKITLGATTQTAGTLEFIAAGGTTYIGSGGIVSAGSGPAFDVFFGNATVATTPVIGASANWASSLNVTLTNNSAGASPIIQTADAGGTAHNITLAGVLSGTGGLNVTGAGTLFLTAADSYSGATTISPGATLQLGDGTTGHDGTITTSSGITDNGALIYNRFGALTSAVPISGIGSVMVTGAGSQTLTGTNTYTGTTTANGTLFVNGSIGSNTTPGGAASVPVGGTLGGTGILTVASASVAGTLAPGAAAGATTGALTLNTTSGLTLSGTLTIALNSTGGVSSGTVLNTGALTLTGATLSLTGAAADGATTYDLVNYTGTLGGDGAFANATIPTGYTINYSGTTFGAADIELDPMAAVPEPSTWIGGALLVLGLGGNVHRRSRAVPA